MSNDANEICFSGLGVTSAIGQGKDPFISSLLAGRHAFDVMQRPGRQIPSQTGKSSKDVPVETAFLGAEIGTLRVPDSIDKKILRTLSFSAQVALATLDEAWQEAKLGDVILIELE